MKWLPLSFSLSLSAPSNLANRLPWKGCLLSILLCPAVTSAAEFRGETGCARAVLAPADSWASLIPISPTRSCRPLEVVDIIQWENGCQGLERGASTGLPTVGAGAGAGEADEREEDARLWVLVGCKVGQSCEQFGNASQVGNDLRRCLL